MENLLTNGTGIETVYNGTSWRIDADSNAVIVEDITPHIGESIPAGSTIQDVFNQLFDNILPNLPSVYEGGMFSTDDNGIDPEYPEVEGLRANAIYIRLERKDDAPVYISCWMIQSELERLETLLGAKVSVSDFDTLNEIVSQKVSQSQLSTLDLKIDNKADKSSITSLQNQIDTKAPATKVTAIENTLLSKADVSEIDALRKQIQTLQTNLEGNITIDDISSITQSLEVINNTLANKVDKGLFDNYAAELNNKASKLTVEVLAGKINNIEEINLDSINQRLDSLANSIINLDKKIATSTTGIHKKADLSYVEQIDSDLKRATTKLDLMMDSKADKKDIAGKANYQDIVQLEQTIASLNTHIKSLERNIDAKPSKAELNSSTDSLNHTINQRYTEFKNHLRTAEISNNSINKDIDNLELKVSSLEKSAGKEWIQILTPEQYKRLPSSRIDPAKLYLLVRFNKPYALYIGSVLIAERGSEASAGFAYTFPMTF